MTFTVIFTHFHSFSLIFTRIFIDIHTFTPIYILLHGNSRKVPMIHGEVGSWLDLWQKRTPKDFDQTRLRDNLPRLFFNSSRFGVYNTNASIRDDYRLSNSVTGYCKSCSRLTLFLDQWCLVPVSACIPAFYWTSWVLRSWFRIQRRPVFLPSNRSKEDRTTSCSLRSEMISNDIIWIVETPRLIVTCSYAFP